MNQKYRLTVFFLCVFHIVFTQETDLPVDFRQHNLTRYNTSLLNPANSYIDNEIPKIATWARLQWLERNPIGKTIFTSYTTRLKNNNALGIGSVLADGGVFTSIGVIGNYSQSFRIGNESSLTLGGNLIVSKRIIDRNNFTQAEFDMFPNTIRDNTLITLMPGINFNIRNFNIGVTSENLLDFNFDGSGLDTSFGEKIFLAHANYSIFFGKSGNSRLDDGYLKISTFFKTVPSLEPQFGGNLMLDLTNGWMQAGYNSFYGPSVGLGAKFFESLGIGVLTELGNPTDPVDLGPTFEFVFSWQFPYKSDGRDLSKKKKKKEIPNPEPKEEKPAEIIVEKQKDSTAIDPSVKFFEPGAQNNRYFVIESIEGVENGFYLVVNVYATEKYFKLFLDKLQKEGLSPKYFYNKENKYYYVYLKKYESIEAIEAARASKYNGRYDGDTWILWIQRNK